MASINFYLNRPNRKGECPLLMTYQDKGLKFRHYTKIILVPSQWDKKKQCVKRNYAMASQINDELDLLKEKIQKIEREARLKGISLNVNYVKEQFEAHYCKKPISNNFYTAFDEFINSAKGIKKSGTIKNYRCSFKRIKAFAEGNGMTLNFDSFDKKFYDKFHSYLINERQYQNNAVGNIVKVLKAFLNYATELGINTKLDFKKYKVYKEDVDLIYLTENELLRLFHLELNEESLKNVRDNFCFACFTGLRFSDIKNFKKENVEGDFILIKTEKTRDTLKIPLNDYAKLILERNKGSLPPSISNQKTNNALKELGIMAEINDNIQLTSYRGSLKECRTVPKHTMISTHTARRTFVTLALEKGIRPELVMEMTGHKDYKTFKKYIKITDKVKLVEMNRLWVMKAA